MPRTPDVFEFGAPILRQMDGMRMHYVPIPDEIGAKLADESHARLKVTINGVALRRALQGRRSGDYAVLVGQQVLRDIGIAQGDMVVVSVRLDGEPDRVDLPDELIAAFEADPEAAERFESFTPGRRRSLAIYVSSAKRPATRERRSLELANKIRTYTLHSDQDPESG